MKKGKVIFWILFSGAVLTGVIVLARKVFGKTDPNKRALDAEKLAKENPTQENLAAASEARTDAEIAAHAKPAEFPLKRGSHDSAGGSFVKRLQLWLIAKFGDAALPRYGADGIFGAEVEKSLAGHGMPVVLDRAWFDSHVGAYEMRNKLLGKALYAARPMINLYEVNSLSIAGTSKKDNYLGSALSVDNPANVAENFVVIDNAGKKYRARVEDVYKKG